MLPSFLSRQDSILSKGRVAKLAMNSPLKLCKQVEVPRSGDCVDRISSLPDELLGHLLSFLPTRCAVSTSILSTRWRYLFTLTNCLSFDDGDAPCFDAAPSFDDAPYVGLRYRVKREIAPARTRRFKKFVYKILELHQVSPIKKFSLVCKDTYDQPDVNAWVSNAVQKRVQDLHYQVVTKEVVLPGGLFMCETLVRLKIVSNRSFVIESPSFWLPRLKILHLEYLSFPDHDLVEKLIPSCESLEELSLRFCQSYRGRQLIVSNGLLKVLTLEDCSFKEVIFKIDAPNIAHLTYSRNTGVKIVPSWKKSCSLVKAELTFKYCAEENYDYDSLKHDCGLTTAAAYRVTGLHLLSDSVELLLPIVEYEEMPDFHKLSRLNLGYCPYYAWKRITSLLDKSPQLETVIFERGLHFCYRDLVYVSCFNEALVPFTCHVKVIEVHRFCWSEHSLLFLGHLVRNAGVLKRLILHKRDDVDMEEELKISNDLRELPMASKDCCIELKKCNNSINL